jgi:hypothetical protein
VTASARRTRPLIAVRLDLADWDTLLAGLGTAAELTTAQLGLTCDRCGSGTGVCATHDGDWQQVDRWRALAAAVRDQLTAQPSTRIDPAR